ncbi:uncharacterized protein LOC111291678 [Durio zibethinus]|uniref:Uncharacterized protein LOC111291678 n=1 Tax=Durio zibethinus TaxID=66656 RepID=A0A6P5YFU3_DURZI|nr:uncharacterized protein LOC111291678 [Durio zibethinus]XP_022739293.1 uncharacterized protein LOC111291678 [Durio zibethinus]
MADQLESMYDVGLKPMMLRSLIRQYVLDEKNRPLNFNNSCFELPKMVYILQTQRLLSESDVHSMDQKLTNIWKSAIDEWVNCLELLLSSDMSDKCWLGICLLGVTCQECSNQRFLSSYSVWLDKLLSHIQPPADSQLVKIASCSSLSDLLTRLARFPKKDGTLHTGKLVQPVLKLLNEDSEEAVWEGASSLLYTIITFFPASMRHYYDRVEAAIASKILSGKCNTKTLKKLGYCLALLPKSKGDKDSWSLMMQKILISINDYLNEAFQGVEEEAKSNEARRLLVPPGRELPSPFGGHTSLEGASCKATRSSERLPTSTVSTLMFCCCKMLTSSYPVQVTAPIQSMLALVERVLMVDGSLPHTMLTFVTAMQQELICSELPILHEYSLELLIAIIKGMRSQLLPHAAYVVRLVTRYFRCALPEMRIKLYSITRMLLISMGVGMAIYLAPDAIDNAFKDLNSCSAEDVETSPSNIRALPHPSNRKRKHGTRTESLEEIQDTTGSEVEAANANEITPITVKIAALDTLEVLLMVGGASKSESWRSRIDSLLIKIATNSCKGGWGSEENNIFLPYESTSIWADFQLSSLRALLASFLAPARVRSPYLSQGLELFRKGKQEAGTKLAGFCAYALLALEVLIHPRALPLDDFYRAYHNSTDGAGCRFQENLYSSGQKQNAMFFDAIQRTEYSALESHDDDLYDRWLQNENESIPVDNMKDKTSGPNLGGKPCANESSLTNILELSEQEPPPAATNADVQQLMVQPGSLQESITKSPEIISSAKGVTSPAVGRNPEATEMEFKRVVSARDNVHGSTLSTLSNAEKGNASDNVHENTFSTLSKAEKGNASVAHWKSDSSDSFPDIVDADPDTDSD